VTIQFGGVVYSIIFRKLSYDIAVYIVDIMYIMLYYGGAKEMNPMLTLKATDVRRDWSTVMETAVREKPQFIKRTRDYMVLADLKFFENLLSAYQFTADEFTEVDGSITLSLNEIDLIENGKTEAEARNSLGRSILEYAEDFYKEFTLWSAAPNRKNHIPYIFKALSIDDSSKIGDSLVLCQAGKS
jgi:hypothetical protein